MAWFMFAVCSLFLLWTGRWATLQNCPAAACVVSPRLRTCGAAWLLAGSRVRRVPPRRGMAGAGRRWRRAPSPRFGWEHSARPPPPGRTCLHGRASQEVRGPVGHGAAGQALERAAGSEPAVHPSIIRLRARCRPAGAKNVCRRARHKPPVPQPRRTLDRSSRVHALLHRALKSWPVTVHQAARRGVERVVCAGVRWHCGCRQVSTQGTACRWGSVQACGKHRRRQRHVAAAAAGPGCACAGSSRVRARAPESGSRKSRHRP